MKVAGKIGIAMMIASLAACSTTGQLLDTPEVRLSGIEMSQIGFDGQTFLLSFDVDNPNPFPLPVSSIRYHVQLANQSFASGETPADFMIPASGNGEFDINVRLDLVRSASQLSTLLQSGMREPLSYELNGSLGINLPYVKPVPFRSAGVITVASN